MTRGMALQKLCGVIFGRNNLVGTDFRDILAWNVERKSVQEVEGGVLIQFVITNHALGKLDFSGTHDALELLLPDEENDRG